MKRKIALVNIVLLLVAVLLAVPPPVYAGNILAVPLRWCALDGSPAVTNPGGAPTPEPDTDSVLWRRHERASDRIWIPGAEITFRSGITAAITQNANFPIIADPCPPTNVTLCQGGTMNPGESCTPDAMGQDPARCGAGIACATQACPAACVTACPGQLGDVRETGNTEYNLVVNACNQAWDRLTGSGTCGAGANQGAACNPGTTGQDPAACGAATPTCPVNSSNALGQVAVNIRSFVEGDGTVAPLKGRAQRSVFNGNSCAIPPTGVTRATGGAILAIDNQRFANLPSLLTGEVAFEQTNERMVAHELGHTLELWHGDGLDNTMPPNNLYDQVCDAAENTCATPLTFMSSTGCGNLSTAATNNQRNTSRAIAGVYTGLTVDPPGTLVPGPNVGDGRPDTPLDVTDHGVDMVTVTMEESSDSETTSFSHALFGLIPLDALSREYAVFADLDGNTTTGGPPSSLGFPTSFQGAELVTSVVVQTSGDIEFPVQSATPTVWRFQGGAFVECNPDADSACVGIVASIFTVLGGDDSAQDPGPPQPQAHVVVIEMPNDVPGMVGDQVRIQAIAQHFIPPNSEIDQAPAEQHQNAGELDRLPDEPEDGARVFVTVPPVFPACGVTPSPVKPGEIVTVEANRLIPNETAKVFLGDQLVAQGPIDGAGETDLDFHVPVDSRSGLRLVTVGVMGTALTADCFAEVLERPPNIPPDCSSAVAGPDKLWPPNHKFRSVNVLGVSDPDGDSVSITITRIFQDEPLKGARSGNTCPDGTGVGTNTAQVRAERAGKGDGRVYHIGFKADDGKGGICTDEVTVCVPHKQKERTKQKMGQGNTCVDGGPLFNSTVCP